MAKITAVYIHLVLILLDHISVIVQLDILAMDTTAPV